MSFNDFKEEIKDLCFDEKVFLKEDFNIDQFLREHRHKATLEGLRDDLGTYLKILRMSMIELINKDYEDFVNLSKDLVGLDKTIEALELPLKGIRDEIEMVSNDLEASINGVKDCLGRKMEIAKGKNSLVYLSQVLRSCKKLKNLLDGSLRGLNMNIVERAVMEFNNLEFARKRCEQVLSVGQKEECEVIGKLLMEVLENTLLECICEKNEIVRCLKMFVSLKKVDKAEKLVQEELIVPFLNNLISEHFLEKEGLKGIYLKLLQFLDVEMKQLIEANLDEFHFVLNSFWIELERRLEVYMSSIFAPGEAEGFHRRFKETSWFFGEVEKRCKIRRKIDLLRSHPQTVHFFHKWNLNVYFKIRFQEIAGGLEQVLDESTITTQVDNSQSNSIFTLKSSWAVFNALQTCWDDSVFLPELADKFWKLSLQIVSRFVVWSNDELKIKKMSHQRNKSGDSITLSLQTSDTLRTQLASYVRLHQDTIILVSNTGNLLQSVFQKIPNFEKNSGKLIESLREALSCLQSILPGISSSIVATIISESALHLNQTRDIPRLFRLTNRESPTKACDYVYQSLQLPSEFLESVSSLEMETLIEWKQTIFAGLAEEFYKRVAEVLTQAQKTEESLMKLKKAKDRTKDVSTGRSGLSDDDKIRTQLYLDVVTFKEEVSRLGANVALCEKLVSLVESARDRFLER